MGNIAAHSSLSFLFPNLDDLKKHTQTHPNLDDLKWYSSSFSSLED